MTAVDDDDMPARKDSHVSVRLPSALKKQLRKLARGEDRTLGDFITLILRRHVEASRKAKAG